MNSKKAIIALITLFINSIFLEGQEFTNQIIRAYAINSSTSIDVYNKYGKIHVISWDKDSVKFVIDLKIKNKDYEKLERIKNSISFEFTPSGYFVIVKTRIGDGTDDAIKDLVNIAGSYFSSYNQITINYTIMLPAYAKLKLENKFGDIYLDDRDADVNLILSYGDLKANNLNASNNAITLNSCDAEINAINEGKITMSYGNLHVYGAQKLSVNSRSSNLNIDKINDLTMSSRRDKIFLPNVQSLYGDSYFSEFSLLGLKEELNFNFRYGKLNIESIDKTFSFININSEYTDIRLTFARGSVYDIDITHHQDVVLSYPRSLGNLTEKVINAQEKLKATFGKIGSGTSESRVTINAPRKCFIAIMHK
jgi:hypothetical protein